VANSLLVGIIRLSPRREDVNGSPRNVSFAVNLWRCLSVPPQIPAAFSSAYSMIFARTSTGSSLELNIRQIILAESPVPLCSAERILRAVLRGNPSILACASIQINPVVISASHWSAARFQNRFWEEHGPPNSAMRAYIHNSRIETADLKSLARHTIERDKARDTGRDEPSRDCLAALA
jgi:hypothetical protein